MASAVSLMRRSLKQYLKANQSKPSPDEGGTADVMREGGNREGNECAN